MRVSHYSCRVPVRKGKRCLARAVQVGRGWQTSTSYWQCNRNSPVPTHNGPCVNREAVACDHAFVRRPSQEQSNTGQLTISTNPMHLQGAAVLPALAYGPTPLFHPTLTCAISNRQVHSNRPECNQKAPYPHTTTPRTPHTQSKRMPPADTVTKQALQASYMLGATKLDTSLQALESVKITCSCLRRVHVAHH